MRSFFVAIRDHLVRRSTGDLATVVENTRIAFAYVHTFVVVVVFRRGTHLRVNDGRRRAESVRGHDESLRAFVGVRFHCFPRPVHGDRPSAAVRRTCPTGQSRLGDPRPVRPTVRSARRRYRQTAVRAVADRPRTERRDRAGPRFRRHFGSRRSPDVWRGGGDSDHSSGG